MTPDVSILLVTKNGRDTLPAVFDAIAAQITGLSVEVVVVDSTSTDGTRELAAARADRVLTIPAEAFNHGGTRNLGVQACRGELVVLLVQDAVPASSTWLDALTRPLRDDARLAGAFARQEARPDASAIARHYLDGWVAAARDSHVTFVDAGAFAALPPADRFHTCIFDNVCACIRRSVWSEHRFVTTPIAEDLEWARDVLLSGHGLAYVPGAVVVHSHDRGARYELARTYLVHQRLRTLFGLATIPTRRSLVRAWASALPLHARLALSDARCGRGAGIFARGLGLAIAFPLGQYLGARSVDLGRELLRARGV